jgi:hypothetical protein
MKHFISLAKIGFVAFLLLCVAAQSQAQPDRSASNGTGYDLSWNTIDGGGGTSAAGGYTLNGTLGQPDARTLAGSTGYTLSGGFWASAPTGYGIFLPVVLRNS